MAEVLDAEAVRTELAGLDGWSGGPAGIARTVEMPGFRDVVDAVNRVAAIAEELDHHPDIDIRWRTVTFRCTTHSVSGVTRRDIELARRIDEAVGGAA